MAEPTAPERTPPDDTTEGEDFSISRERVDLSTARMIARATSESAMEARTALADAEDDTTAPVTAEDLRERAAFAVLRFHGREEAPTETEQALAQGTADAVLAALAGDPGDLSAQDVERHLERRIAAQQATIGRQSDEVERLRERYGIALQRSLDEGSRANRAEAEGERLRAELAEERERRDRYRTATGNWTSEALKQRERAEQAESERDALKAAIERVEARCRNLELGASAVGVEVPHWVAPIRAALATPETTPDAPTEDYA